MVLLSDGDPVVTGRMNVTGRGDEFETIRFDNATGELLWESKDGGAARLDDRALSVAVGDDDCPVVTGIVQNADGTATLMTVKYDGTDGGVLWTNLLPGMVNDQSGDGWVVLLPGGDPVVCCKAWGGSTSYDILLARLDAADGSVVWQRQWTNGTAMDDPSDLILTADGDPLVVGGTAGDYLVARFAAGDGSLVWLATYDGPPGWYDVAACAALGDAGEILVSGFSDGSGTSWDVATIGLDPADGAQRWVVRYDGPAHQSDEGKDLVLAPDHRLYVAGYCYGDTTGMDQLLLAYDHAPTTAAPGVPRPRLALRAAPNPFNPTVRLAVDLPRDGAVRLEIRDLRGRLVRVLADAVQPAGLRSWRWDGRDREGRPAPSGLYLARLLVDGTPAGHARLVLAR